MLKVTYTDTQWKSGNTAIWLGTEDEVEWLRIKQEMGMHSTMNVLKVEPARACADCSEYVESVASRRDGVITPHLYLCTDCHQREQAADPN